MELSSYGSKGEDSEVVTLEEVGQPLSWSGHSYREY